MKIFHKSFVLCLFLLLEKILIVKAGLEIALNIQMF